MTKNPLEFVREVRAEVARVTWPTRRETMITTSMVFIFVVIGRIGEFPIHDEGSVNSTISSGS
eukprot:gene34434-38928_t